MRRRQQHGAAGRGARLSVHARSIPVTAAGDGVEHEVTDDAMGGGHPGGRYRALCGELIAPAALTEPPGRPCPGCAVELTPLPELCSADSHAQRRAVAPWLHNLTARTNRLAIQEAVIGGVAA